jgi:hypothetical protein
MASRSAPSAKIAAISGRGEQAAHPGGVSLGQPVGLLELVPGGPHPGEQRGAGQVEEHLQEPAGQAADDHVTK